jgi:penicillin V acylase-like amidase (Ntn superfamily)
MMKKLLLAAIFLMVSITSYPCTSFVFRNTNRFYLGKTMDYNTGKGFIFVNQRNSVKMGFSIPPEKPTQWKSRYGSITFNIYGKDMPNSGINEKGLVVESLWLDETAYPLPDQRDAIPELAWIQYMLDNCTSVDEVIEANKIMRIASTSFAKIHFMILDDSGKSAIIEFINGFMKIYRDDELPYEVLENQTYEKSLKFMLTHPQGAHSFLNAIGDKRERFEMMAQMLTAASEESDAIDYCFQMLHKVSWTRENGDAPTQWAVVYDPANRRIKLKTKDSEAIKTIHISDFDFACSGTLFIAPLQTTEITITPSVFFPYTLEEAKVHLRGVYEEVPFTRGRIPDELLEGMLQATQNRGCR